MSNRDLTPCINMPPPDRKSAFTLVEILVAMAIFGLMVAFLLNLTGQASNLWQTGEGQVQRRASGRALLQYIAREIQIAALPVRQPAHVGTGVSERANLQLIANISENNANATQIPQKYLNPHGVFWQAPIAKNNSRGNLACIGYFVKWDEANAKSQLCRYFVDPSDISEYKIYQNNSGTAVNWLSNIDTVAPASESNLQGWFADHVIGLWVRCLDAQGEPITQNAAGDTLESGYGFDSRQGYIDSLGRTHSAPALPAAVEIAIVILDSRTAKRLTQPVHGTSVSPSSFHADIARFVDSLPEPVRKGAQTFSTRVKLQNSAL